MFSLISRMLKLVKLTVINKSKKTINRTKKSPWSRVTLMLRV